MANIFLKENGQFTRQFPPLGVTGTPALGSRAMDSAMYGGGAVSIGNSQTPPPTVPMNTPPVATASTSRTFPPVAQPSPYANRPPQGSTMQGTTSNSNLDPYTAYSMLLMKQLKDAQSGTDNTDLLKQQRDLQRESIRLSQGNDVQTFTPGLKGGMSPGQYSQVRDSQVSALSGSIDEVGFQLKKLENKRKDIIDQLTFAQKAGDTAKEQELKAKAFDLDQQKFGETVRANKASEGIASAKLKAEFGAGNTKNTGDQLKFLKETANSALALAGASGRSGARKAAEAFAVGSTDYTNLEAYTNTLRTNVLTLMTNPDIKKFFGPQMSEADVRLMTAAGTTLNPELQSSDVLKTEIGRLYDLLNRMEKALPSSEQAGGGSNSSQTIPKGTDGTSYGFPGYVSDGSQWVLK